MKRFCQTEQDTTLSAIALHPEEKPCCDFIE